MATRSAPCTYSAGLSIVGFSASRGLPSDSDPTNDPEDCAPSIVLVPIAGPGVRHLSCHGGRSFAFSRRASAAAKAARWSGTGLRIRQVRARSLRALATSHSALRLAPTGFAHWNTDALLSTHHVAQRGTLPFRTRHGLVPSRTHQAPDPAWVSFPRAISHPTRPRVCGRRAPLGLAIGTKPVALWAITGLRHPAISGWPPFRGGTTTAPCGGAAFDQNPFGRHTFAPNTSRCLKPSVLQR